MGNPAPAHRLDPARKQEHGGNRSFPRAQIVYTSGPDAEWFKHKNYRDDFEVGEKIGEGSFGLVFSAKRKQTVRLAQIKVIGARSSGLREGRRSIGEGCEILLKYGVHENICRLYNVYNTGQEIAMCLELVQGGDLFDGIITAAHNKLSEAFWLRR